MDELISSFVQHLPQLGYQLKTLNFIDLNDFAASGDSTEALCWPQETSGSRDYRPLEDEEALFLKFADMGEVPDDLQILAFADRYGWLGLGSPAVAHSRHAEQKLDTPVPVITGEPTDTWRQQLQIIVPLQKLWSAVSIYDETYLRSAIVWKDDFSSVAYQYHSTNVSFIASSNHDPELFNTLARGDLVTAAKIFLVRSINQHLASHCSPALLFNAASFSASHLRFRCDNLLAVIWLQFARAISSDSKFRRCAECALPFIPRSAERGKKRRFCTDACKSRNYRGEVTKKTMSSSRLH